ncbi:MAG: hypothetical protein CLLPBCKN_006181 [Chroococcidiopsis cubana SAG 39.79]|uniref:MULE transposase domain-containing protein n=2 Tax=Chroococcidiopsis TaxID=54298 RepID=A0AB37UHB0_9CYAN|nr:hypothetical protein [Chroococcidiopsis cubana SAG 39.79]RUT10589.1 hypothetical protein DSM107010_41560 [Chroococcidiopsis cubana SAG 39.79]
MGCFLGVEIAQGANAAALSKAYGAFQQEALQLNPDYHPESVNTDGWEGTQNAWKAIFPEITLILCFLHTVLGIQQRCRRGDAVFQAVTDKLWHLYHSLNLRQFSQRLRRLLEWTLDPDTDLPQAVRQKLLSLKAKAPQFTVTFEMPDAARTSNQVDRLMNYQDRILYTMQYFHGTLNAANQALRAMALLWNFHPYCRKVQTLEPHSMSPFEDLNGFRYHKNWLRNLLLASSLNGRRIAQPLKHKLI